MIDLSGAVLMCASGTYDGVRRTPPSPPNIGGVRQPFNEEPLIIRGSVQPATGLQVERLPEGKRNREAMVVITPDKLRSLQDGDVPDLIYIDGGTFEVDSVQRWNLLGNFFEALVLRVEGT